MLIKLLTIPILTLLVAIYIPLKLLTILLSTLYTGISTAAGMQDTGAAGMIFDI